MNLQELQTFLALLPDAAVLTDREGMIQGWNPAASRVFGIQAQQALGANLDLIIPEKHRKSHWDAWAKALAQGSSHYGTSLLQVPALKGDGSRLSIAFSISLIQDDLGQIVGVLALIRDETARWAETKALKEALKLAQVS